MISSDIIFKAETLRRSWGIDNASPLNILSSVLENVGDVTILWFPMIDEVSGCCSKSRDDKIICINSKHSRGRQNFTIAHELYHLIYEDDKDSFICNFNSNDESERNADKFASSLLIPNVALYDFIKKHDIEAYCVDEDNHNYAASLTYGNGYYNILGQFEKEEEFLEILKWIYFKNM